MFASHRVRRLLSTSVRAKVRERFDSKRMLGQDLWDDQNRKEVVIYGNSRV